MSDIPTAVAAPVAEALRAGGPVVALESTIITHGLPRPKNLEVARALEERVREGGAVPATIALMRGVLKVGLDEDELAELSEAADIVKLSRADLAVAIAKRASGSTTVAATMIGARLAGIKVFATGGIGGVHRGAERTMDISADLQELARTPVTVVCAGAKAILDLPKTLEVLETLGVPVIGYRTSTLPAFWSRDSGLPLSLRLDDPSEIAHAHALRIGLGLEGGQLVVCPIPHEAEIPAHALHSLIEDAVREADAAGITGKALTPFLLQTLMRTTKGRSLEANVALVLNNAAVGAEIAVALAGRPPHAAGPAQT